MSDPLPFYRRHHSMTEALSAAIVTALRENTTWRFGQLVCNALGVKDADLFMIHDELALDRLAAACENEPNAYGCEYGAAFNGGCAIAATLDSPPPERVQMVELLQEQEKLRARVSDAVALIDRFHRHALDSEGYPGSPLADDIQDYLESVGVDV